MTDRPSGSDSDFELQALLDATVDAVILVDSRGRIQVFNRAAERLFGYAAKEVFGLNVNVLMTDKDSGSHDAYMHRYMETGIPHIIGIGREVDARRRDGTVFPAFLSVGRIPHADPPRFVGFIHDITVRQQAVAAVQRERDRANNYLDVAQTILLALDVQGRVSLINRKGCEVLGVSEDRLLGSSWADGVLAPEDRAWARAEFEHVLRAQPGQPHYCEYHVDTARGDRRLVAWHCVSLRDAHGTVTGMLCSGEDITERRAIEQSIERTRALLHEAQSIAHVGNFELYVPAQRDDYWSPEAYRICGLDAARDRLDSRVLLAMAHPEDREQATAGWQDSLAQPGQHVSEFRLVQPAGDERHVELRYQITPAPDGRLRVAGTLHDVTETRRAEAEARETQQRMTHVSRLATMGEMAAGIAHELNQPLAAIASYAQACDRLLAGTDPDIPEIRDALRQVAGQALRAGEIIRRLRSLVRNQETQRDPTDVNELIEELSILTRTDARMHEARLVYRLGEGLPTPVIDRIQIQQVLLNLIRNAIEALDAVEPAKREITITTGLTADGDIQIEVADTGPGVDAGLVDRIFDPFCTTKATGTGLGLAISRTIVQSHKGTLRYRPNEPGGACLCIRLPASSGEGQ